VEGAEFMTSVLSAMNSVLSVVEGRLRFDYAQREGKFIITS